MSQSTHHGLCDGKLPMLHPVLRRWCLTNERLGTRWQAEDAPWWHNERTSLGVFAGAVWQSGGWVLEEFATSKTIQENRKKKLEFTGFCDIRFGGEGYTFIAEAKQCWPNLGGNAGNVQKAIGKGLEEACDDCRQEPRWGPVWRYYLLLPD